MLNCSRTSRRSLVDMRIRIESTSALLDSVTASADEKLESDPNFVAQSAAVPRKS
jgi:hypothetical protein